MNYDETLNYIHSLGNFSLPAGLDRIKKVLKILGNPQNDFKSIHIAGTNGKGSVAAMLTAIFKEAGYKTGTFISPFIIDFKERIQINTEFISSEDLCFYAQKVIDTNVKLTEFEFITAVAFLYFKEKKINVLICETGLGGRLDATNTLENSVLKVITKIGLDHTGILGQTVEEIAAEKCGILRQCPTVTTPYQSKAALEVIKSKASHLIIPDIDSFELLENNTYIYKDKKYELALKGDFQIENSLVAIEAALNSGFDISYNHIYAALKRVSFPARLEVISSNPLIILDGAHNPDGATVLARELEKFEGKATAIIGMMRDKNVEETLKITLRHCKSAVAVTVPRVPRALSGEELCQIAEKYCECTVADSIESALEQITDAPLFIFGSLYLASYIRPLLLEKN